MPKNVVAKGMKIMENEMYYCNSDLKVKEMIDSAISCLEKIKKDVTELNFNHYHIKIDQSRDLEPFYSFISHDNPIGFRQIGPDRLIICVENTINLGKEFISESEYVSSPWKSPTKEETELLDKELKKLVKTGKKSKRGRLKFVDYCNKKKKE